MDNCENENKTTTSKFEKINKWISLVASIATIIGVIFGSSYIYKIANNINASFANINNVNVNTESKTMESELYEAQGYVAQGQYESAMKIYQKWQNSSAIANINIGYLYSNALGVEQDTEIAGTYYKKAHKMGDPRGLTNYLFINLAKPISYTQTITALRYGYDNENESTLKFLSLLITDSLESKYSNTTKTNADAFWNLDIQNQKELLLKYTIENVDYIEKLEDKDIPQDTDFTEYKLTTINGSEYLYKAIAGYVEMYDNDTKSYNWEPVYDIKNYYTKHSKHFIYADLLFDEQLAKQ